MDDRVGKNAIVVPANWLPHALYSHLPLIEYLDAHPLDRWTADPGDLVRSNWKDDPINKFDKGFWLPLQPEPNENNKRWPYASSYLPTPATWDQNQSDLQADPGTRVSQALTHNSYTISASDSNLFPMNLADVAFPAHKVYLHDQSQRHFAPCQSYFADSRARLPLAFLNGSVSVRHTSDSDFGWRPTAPAQPCMAYKYQPSPWEPPTCSGDLFDLVVGRFHWTRAGLKGVDFGGAPIDMGQSDDCPI